MSIWFDEFGYSAARAIAGNFFLGVCKSSNNPIKQSVQGLFTVYRLWERRRDESHAENNQQARIEIKPF